jgi:hypothetical protein
VCGGHNSLRAIAYKILRDGYYWPTLFVDSNALVQACIDYKIFVGKQKLLPIPIIPIKFEAPFQHWGPDFVGEIKPNSSGQHKCILISMDYFTKWVEVIPTRDTTDTTIIKFL